MWIAVFFCIKDSHSQYFLVPLFILEKKITQSWNAVFLTYCEPGLQNYVTSSRTLFSKFENLDNEAVKCIWCSLIYHYDGFDVIWYHYIYMLPFYSELWADISLLRLYIFIYHCSFHYLLYHVIFMKCK